MTNDILEGLRDDQVQLVLDVIKALREGHQTSSLYGKVDSQIRYVLSENTDCVFWSIDDFKMANSDLYRSYDYTDAELREAMHHMFSKHDAAIGINWDVLSHYLPVKEVQCTL